MTLLLALFALTPAADALACDADEPPSASLAAAISATTGDSQNERSQHRCYCAGHCCPAGMTADIQLQTQPLAMRPLAPSAIQAEEIVSRVPPTLERPPRA